MSTEWPKLTFKHHTSKPAKMWQIRYWNKLTGPLCQVFCYTISIFLSLWICKLTILITGFCLEGRKLMIWAHFIGINLIYILKIVCTNWLALIYLNVGVTLPVAVRIMSICWALVGLLGCTFTPDVLRYSFAPQSDRCLLHTSMVDTEIDYTRWFKY